MWSWLPLVPISQLFHDKPGSLEDLAEPPSFPPAEELPLARAEPFPNQILPISFLCD